MSTKTNFKRIALVAVAALGLGVLSSVPSQAEITGLTLTVVDGTATLAKSDSTTAATITIAGLIESADSITVEVVKKTTPTSGPVPNLHFQNLDSNTPTGGIALTDTQLVTAKVQAATAGGNILKRNPDVTPGFSDTALAVASANTTKVRYASNATLNMSQVLGLVLDSATARIAGTYTYTVVVKAYNAGSTKMANAIGTQSFPDTQLSADVSIVVATPATSSTTPTATYSYVDISSNTGAGNSAGRADTTDSVISALATAGTAAGSIFIGNRNADGGASTAKESITATVVGAGLVCTGTLASASAGSCGKSLKVAATGDYQFLLQADGTSGLSTITVSSSVSGISAVKTLNYYSVAAKTLTASILTPVLAIGANDSAVSVVASDSAGVSWAGQAYIYASAAADATAVGGSATTPVACSYSSSKAVHWCPITATAAGTGKFKVIDASTVALATATSNELTVKSSNATAATLKIAFNKASYAPGEIGQITITPLDASGADLAAVTLSSGLASGGVTSNLDLTYAGVAVTGLTSSSITTSAYTGTALNAGKKTFVFSAPMTGGTLTVTAKGGTSLPTAGQVTITASATITDNGAAALAAVTALATTVASLKTLITTLTNLVLKIQKKVKA